MLIICATTKCIDDTFSMQFLSFLFPYCNVGLLLFVDDFDDFEREFEERRAKARADFERRKAEMDRKFEEHEAGVVGGSKNQ